MPMRNIPKNLDDAVGRTIVAEDELSPAPVAGLMAAFGSEDPSPQRGDALRPLWHGLFCTAKLPPSRLGADGLAKDEGWLPAAPEYPNKLFGGARFTFHHPLCIGDTIRKESEVMSFDLKEGRTGPFIVGLIEHRISNGDGVAVVEQNDIVYRAVTGPAKPPSGGGSKKAAGAAGLPAAPVWSRTITPDAVLMFRHSAVTFNSHRIHYDRDYVREKGYPGLLVQGTLIARLMLDMVAVELPEFAIGAFSFRSGRPVYDDGDFTLCAAPAANGAQIDLWALDHEGNIGMTAQAQKVAS
ncbi:MAG: 3-methylfumaryl-CoA hydratase [Paracoccaceae bacterium]|jgi:3-methylfumaryl-CoA hydratase